MAAIDQRHRGPCGLVSGAGDRLRSRTEVTVEQQLNSQFQYDPDLSHASEVEVSFTEADGKTTVDFEHRHLERLGVGAEELAKSVASDGGWPGILDLYAKAAAAA